MRRGPEGKGIGLKMPWERLPLLPLGGGSGRTSRDIPQLRDGICLETDTS